MIIPHNFKAKYDDKLTGKWNSRQEFHTHTSRFSFGGRDSIANHSLVFSKVNFICKLFLDYRLNYCAYCFRHTGICLYTLYGRTDSPLNRQRSFFFLHPVYYHRGWQKYLLGFWTISICSQFYSTEASLSCRSRLSVLRNTLSSSRHNLRRYL